MRVVVLASESDEMSRRTRTYLASLLQAWSDGFCHCSTLCLGSAARAMRSRRLHHVCRCPRRCPCRLQLPRCRLPHLFAHLHRHRPQGRRPRRPRCPHQRLPLPTNHQGRHLAFFRAQASQHSWLRPRAAASSSGHQPLCVWFVHRLALARPLPLPQCTRFQAFPRTLCITSS